MWKEINLEPIVSGCPNCCRHCSEEGGPPFGALMSLDDVKGLVDEFARAFEDTLGGTPEMRPWLDTFEPTVHPDMVRLKEYERSFLSQSRRRENSLLSSNGYGLARAADWRGLCGALTEIGLTGIGFAIHGPEAEHDWFAQRVGAHSDVVVAAERAHEAGMELQFQVYPSKAEFAYLRADS